ncbi:hypothetical protein TrCOL_g11367 [Triparma columacea]|uniref:Uncharacterized protein n=1 Tax=Triparma columacea TaxID=722753 RepID=A0A9W7LC75_9STRA|nr:hypothetical protein TrCOL_g11367 [Triparma columacea]
MAQFLPYERVHHYSGRAMTAPARASNFEIDGDDDKENSSVYAGEDTNAGMFGKSRRSSQPKNATLCYVMDGGGLTLRGDTTSNMGKFRLKEHERINSENMRTHDRLTKPDGPCRSYIPKTRKSKKPTGIVSQNGETRRRKERERLAAENRKLTKALNGIYRGKARLEKHGVKKKDCRKIWSNRTSIYDVENMRKNGIIKAKTGVPKTAALVACGGCGLKTFYGADGLTVHKGNHGNMDAGHTVYYCNDVCAAVDWEINRENINVQHKGFRPLRKANYWVQSRAASKARAMLRRAVEGGELPDLDRIMHEIRVQRSVGAAQSAAIAKKLPGNEEEDRQAGMSGTDKAKRHIIRGAAHLVDFDSYPEPDVWFGKEPPKGSTREQIAREKRERYNADVKEVERIVREGNMMGKGMVDKNARSKTVKEKVPNPAKWKGGSKVSLKADPNSGAAFEDAKEMYKSSAALQRERDAEAKRNAQAAAKIANRGRKAKKQQVARAEYEAYNETEEKREGKFNIRRVDHKPKPKRRVQFVEKPASFNGLQYDATKNKRNNESMVSEPKKVVVDAEDDPALFRQSMDSIKLSK